MKQVKAAGIPSIRPEMFKGESAPAFPFHYGNESESYTFYRLPKILFRKKLFGRLSNDAILLYGIFLDRMELSRRNGWFDEEGRVFIYFPVQSIMSILRCGNKKVSQLLAELDDKTGIGLITRTHQGLGKPDRIYVHRCAVPELPVLKSPVARKENSGDPLDFHPAAGGIPAASSEVSKEHSRECEKDMAGKVEKTSLAMSKAHTNDTENKKTERRNIYSINSCSGSPEEAGQQDTCTTDQHCIMNNGFESADGQITNPDGYDRSDGDLLLEEFHQYRDYFEEACCFEYLLKNNPALHETIDGIMDILAETCCSRKPLIRIGGEDKPGQIVRSRLMKLDSSHIQYVLDSMNDNTTQIRNIRQYLLTSLYNAPVTIESYYRAQANYEMYGRGG